MWLKKGELLPTPKNKTRRAVDKPMVPDSFVTLLIGVFSSFTAFRRTGVRGFLFWLI